MDFLLDLIHDCTDEQEEQFLISVRDSYNKELKSEEDLELISTFEQCYLD